MKGDDIPNSFTDARMLDKSANPAVYHRTGQEFQRGDPQFIMSRGHIQAFAECPAKWRAGGVAEEKNWQTDFGSWLDCLFLSPDLADKCFAVTPATYPATPKRKDDPPENKPWTRQANHCKEWEAERVNEGRQVIHHEINSEVVTALEELYRDMECMAIRMQSDHQVFCMAQWQDKETGFAVPVKALLDIVPHLGSPWPKVIFDFKTTGDGSPWLWPRQLFKQGYDLQAALYLDIYSAATGEDRNTFAHLVIENEPPYHITKPFMALSGEFLDIGRGRYRAALAKYCQCLKTNEWPSYPVLPGTLVRDGLQFIGPQPWMLNA